jgi:hypothetical protein
MRWRLANTLPNPRDAGRIEVISCVECVLVLCMVLAAVSMARGLERRLASQCRHKRKRMG